MPKKPQAPAALSHAEHVALLDAEHAAALTRARHAHAVTRAHAHELATEVAALRARDSARQSAESLQSDVQQAAADGQAALSTLTNLTAAIRKTHNLSERHAIDSATGAIILPEA